MNWVMCWPKLTATACSRCYCLLCCSNWVTCWPKLSLLLPTLLLLLLPRRYSALTLLLPEVKELVCMLAEALPDKGYTRMGRAMDTVIRTSKHLISSWRASAPAAAAAAAAVALLPHGKESGAAAAAAHRAVVVATAAAAAAASGPAGPGGAVVAAGSFLGHLLNARAQGSGEPLSDTEVGGAKRFWGEGLGLSDTWVGGANKVWGMGGWGLAWCVGVVGCWPRLGLSMVCRGGGLLA